VSTDSSSSLLIKHNSRAMPEHDRPENYDDFLELDDEDQLTEELPEVPATNRGNKLNSSSIVIRSHKLGLSGNDAMERFRSRTKRPRLAYHTQELSGFIDSSDPESFLRNQTTRKTFSRSNKKFEQVAISAVRMIEAEATGRKNLKRLVDFLRGDGVWGRQWKEDEDVQQGEALENRLEGDEVKPDVNDIELDSSSQMRVTQEPESNGKEKAKEKDKERQFQAQDDDEWTVMEEHSHGAPSEKQRLKSLLAPSANRLLDPQIWLDRLFVSQHNVELFLTEDYNEHEESSEPNEDAGRETAHYRQSFDHKSQREIANEAIGQLETFLSQMVDLVETLGEIRNGIMEVDRRRKAIGKVGRMVVKEEAKKARDGAKN
jgi:hypothetical protein